MHCYASWSPVTLVETLLSDRKSGALAGKPTPRSRTIMCMGETPAILTDEMPVLLDRVPVPDVVDEQHTGPARLRVGLVADTDRDLLHGRQVDAGRADIP